MAKTKDFVSSVRELVPEKRSLMWHQKLDKENAARLQAAGEAWLRGELGKYARPVAKALAIRFGEYGVTVSECSVREWLSNLKR